MVNPFFAAMSGGQPNLMGMLQQLKANPVQFIMQRKLNVPQSVSNDPNAIMQYLLQTGQKTQSQINQAYQMANRLRP